MPYQTLMPKYAQDVMQLDASGLGILVAAPGVGSLISSLVMASMGDFQGKGKLLLGSGVLLGVGLVLFSNTQIFILVLIFLAIVGATSNICMVTNQMLLQVNCESAYLGRLMSAYMMMFGLTQLGAIPIGAFADRFGVPEVLSILGALYVLAIILVWVKQYESKCWSNTFRTEIKGAHEANGSNPPRLTTFAALQDRRLSLVLDRYAGVVFDHPDGQRWTGLAGLRDCRFCPGFGLGKCRVEHLQFCSFSMGRCFLLGSSRKTHADPLDSGFDDAVIPGDHSHHRDWCYYKYGT